MREGTGAQFISHTAAVGGGGEFAQCSRKIVEEEKNFNLVKKKGNMHYAICHSWRNPPRTDIIAFFAMRREGRSRK